MNYLVAIRDKQQLDWVIEYCPSATNQYARSIGEETGTWMCVFNEEDYTLYELRWG